VEYIKDKERLAGDFGFAAIYVFNQVLAEFDRHFSEIIKKGVR
jgi:hypothetical protein